jgi:2',5'-phosphodiesterase
MNAAILPVQPHVTPRRAGSTRLQLRGAGMVRAAAFVDVRQSGDGHDALLTVVVPLFSGSRTLSRPACEPLSKALARLRAALAPPPKRLSRADKRARSSSAGAPGRVDAGPADNVYVAVLDGAGVALDEDSVSNAQAWVAGHVLAVDTHRYPVRLNVPLISHLRLAFDVPCCGYPLLPTPVGLQFCTPDTVAWRWTRHVTGGSDVMVCTTQRYVPVDQDIGCVLSCTCTLPLLDAPPAPGARWEAATARAVTQQVLPRRDRGAALQRLAALGSPRRSAGSVRIMSYNVLADAYAHTWGRLYPYLQPQHSGPGYRLPAALHDVAAAGADVVCLQEVDVKWFDRFWLPQLTALGYTCSHTPKNSTAGEGCALCVRSDRYSVAELRHVDLRAGALPGLPTPPSALAPLLGAHPAMLTAMGRVNTVAQLAVLLPVKQSGDMAAPPPLLVANTHLFFHPGAPHIRILQADALLRAAAGMRQEWDAAAALSLVVCGDLNAEPHDGAVEYLTAGHVDADHQDWDACASFTFEPPPEAVHRGAAPSQSQHVAPSQPLPCGFDLPRDAAGFGCAADGGGAALAHPFGPLQSGCGKQEFTNYVGGFVAVLDYILHDATLVSVAAAPAPSVEDVTRQTALPNAQFPSDHVPQVCDLQVMDWR